MEYTCIQYDVSDRIASITLNRPEKRNALNARMVQELADAFRAAEEPGIRVVVLKGSGTVFSAGADLASLERLQHNTYEENLADSRQLMELMLQMYRHPRLLIAQVEGHAIAGGCGLACLCDLCYAVPEAGFGYTEVRIGFIPALVSVFLLRRVGEGRARELLLTGRLLSGEEAVGAGLVTALAPKDAIGGVVRDRALSFSRSTSAQAVAQTRQLLAELQDPAPALELAAKKNALARGTEDCLNGVQAFLKGQPVSW
jgi:methylglutaconyl-CoA hydratase